MIPLRLIPQVGVPGILTTIVAMIVALLVVRFLLKVAVRVAIVAALVVGVLWFFGALHLLPDLAIGL